MFLCDEVLAQRDGDGESPAARPELHSKPPFSIDEMLCSFISTYTCRLFYFTQNAGSESYESTLQSTPIMVTPRKVLGRLYLCACMFPPADATQLSGVSPTSRVKQQLRTLTMQKLCRSKSGGHLRSSYQLLPAGQPERSIVRPYTAIYKQTRMIKTPQP